MMWCKSVCRYSKRRECTKKSFKSSYLSEVTYRGKLVELSIEGDNILDEVLSDIEVLDNTLRLDNRSNRKQPLLPGVNFTHHQMLYINIAQVRKIP